jgi:polyhydroxyalkanoate synthesis regulator phasin
MWKRAGTYKRLWNIPGMARPIHGVLRVTKRGHATVELMLDDDETSALFARFAEPLRYETVVSATAEDSFLDVVSLLGVGHLALDKLYANQILFGVEATSGNPPAFASLDCELGDLGAWALIADEPPISIPVMSIQQRADHEVTIRMPSRVAGDDRIPDVGLHLSASARNFMQLRYDFLPTLSWKLESPLGLDACVSLVHDAYCFVILLADSVVEINSLSLQTTEGQRAELVYEPNPVSRRRRDHAPLVRLYDIQNDYRCISGVWTRLRREIPEAIGVATQFYYSDRHGPGQLFELVAALESLHAFKHPKATFIPEQRFREIKRTLADKGAADADLRKLINIKLDNRPTLRARLNELTSSLVEKGMLSDQQRHDLVDDLVSARNCFGHRLGSPFRSREHLRRVCQAHIVLKSLLLDELGLLDTAMDKVKRQWRDWERW